MPGAVRQLESVLVQRPAAPEHRFLSAGGATAERA